MGKLLVIRNEVTYVSNILAKSLQTEQTFDLLFPVLISAAVAQNVLAMELAPISYVPPELIHLLHVRIIYKAQTTLLHKKSCPRLHESRPLTQPGTSHYPCNL